MAGDFSPKRSWLDTIRENPAGVRPSLRARSIAHESEIDKSPRSGRWRTNDRTDRAKRGKVMNARLRAAAATIAAFSLIACAAGEATPAAYATKAAPPMDAPVAAGGADMSTAPGQPPDP